MLNIEKEFETQKFNIMENTFDALVAVAGHSPVGTYDGRSAMKAFKKFQNIKVTYANLISFAEYMYSISRYFKIAENQKLFKNISRKLKQFANNYEMFLL